jgi:hypothetical protein
VLAAIIAVAMIGQIAHGNFAGSGDAVHYMVAAHSVAFDRDLDVANDYSDPSRIIRDPAGAHAQPGVDGVLRPVHDVGLPIVAAPVVALAYAAAGTVNNWPPSLVRRAKLNPFIVLRQLLSLAMIAATIGLALLFFETSAALTGQRTWAFVWTLAWALSPPILTHGYVFLTEIPSALIALFVFVRRGDLRGSQATRHGVMLGLLTGLLFLVHVRNIGLVLALAALIVWRVRQTPMRALGYAAGLAVMGCVKVAINLRFWGAPLTNPHEHLGAWPGLAAFLSQSATSFAGLLFDARHGLLLAAPIFLLAPAAWILLKRQSRTTAYELLILMAAYLIFVINPVTNIHGWRGGWSPAARFLVPIVSFAALAVPAVLAVRGRMRAGVVIIGAQLIVSAYLWGHPMQQWSEGPGPAAFVQALAGSPAAASIPPIEQLSGPVLAYVSVALLITTGVTWMLVRKARA